MVFTCCAYNPSIASDCNGTFSDKDLFVRKKEVNIMIKINQNQLYHFEIMHLIK
jgi:hypothetical protein